MNRYIAGLSIGICLSGLAGCKNYDDIDYLAYNPYPDDYRMYSGYQSPESYQNPYRNYRYADSEYRPVESTTVQVPETYHVGSYHSPVSFKERDQAWVASQNGQGYTIQISEGSEAAAVAQALNNAPKNDRRAQVSYERGGKRYYKGVYGSFNSLQDAQKALDTLPETVRSSARIKNWSSIQGQ